VVVESEKHTGGGGVGGGLWQKIRCVPMAEGIDTH